VNCVTPFNVLRSLTGISSIAADGRSMEALSVAARYAASALRPYRCDVVIRLQIDQQVTGVDAGAGGQAGHRHRDRLLPGADAVLLRIERLAGLITLCKDSDLYPVIHRHITFDARVSTTTLRARTSSVTCQAAA